MREEKEFVSTCQYEVDIDASYIFAVEGKGEYNLIAPLRLFSFDIECSA